MRRTIHSRPRRRPEKVSSLLGRESMTKRPRPRFQETQGQAPADSHLLAGSRPACEHSRVSSLVDVCVATLTVALLSILAGCGEAATPEPQAVPSVACPADMDQLLGLKSHHQREAECKAFRRKCPRAVDWTGSAAVAGRNATLFGPVVGTSYRPDVSGNRHSLTSALSSRTQSGSRLSFGKRTAATSSALRRTCFGARKCAFRDGSTRTMA